MIIGVPKEIKDQEYRVGIVPGGVEELTVEGHRVLIEAQAGAGSGISDAEYREAGAEIVCDRRRMFREADLVLKVKEPQPAEVPLLRRGQAVFCYFHFAANPKLLQALLRSRITALAFETLRTSSGAHPLLTPMSEVAGKMAVQEGAKYLERSMGGKGILLGGVAGVRPAKVVVLGGVWWEPMPRAPRRAWGPGLWCSTWTPRACGAWRSFCPPTWSPSSPTAEWCGRRSWTPTF